MQSMRFLATLATIAVGLAGLEWWSASELYGSERIGGPITGIAFVAVLAVLPRLLNLLLHHLSLRGCSRAEVPAQKSCGRYKVQGPGSRDQGSGVRDQGSEMGSGFEHWLAGLGCGSAAG